MGKELAESVDIPFSIGAGPDTDAQVLVHDMLGISRKLPKFSKNYLEQCTSVQEAINKFGEDVRKGVFQAPSTALTKKSLGNNNVPSRFNLSISVPTSSGEEKSLADYQGKVVLMSIRPVNAALRHSMKDCNHCMINTRNAVLKLSLCLVIVWRTRAGHKCRSARVLPVKLRFKLSSNGKVKVKGSDQHPLFAYLTTEVED